MLVAVDDYRVRCVVKGATLPIPKPVPSLGAPTPDCRVTKNRSYFEDGWHDVDVWDMDLLKPGHSVKGPAIIVQSISTIVVEVGCVGNVTSDGDLEVDIPRSTGLRNDSAKEEKVREHDS